MRGDRGNSPRSVEQRLHRKLGKFDPERYAELAALGTAAESFVILHEHGHLALGPVEHSEENELDADRWALERLVHDAETRSSLFLLGPFVFLSLCHLVETFSARSAAGAAVAQTHPGAPLRLAQAAVECASVLGPLEREKAAQFTALVDAAIVAETGRKEDAILTAVFTVALGLRSLFADHLALIAQGSTRRQVLEALLETARAEPEARTEGSARAAGSELQPGLTASDDDGVYLYELPSGHEMEMVLVPKGPFLRPKDSTGIPEPRRS